MTCSDAHTLITLFLSHRSRWITRHQPGKKKEIVAAEKPFLRKKKEIIQAINEIVEATKEIVATEKPFSEKSKNSMPQRNPFPGKRKHLFRQIKNLLRQKRSFSYLKPGISGR